jgi:hypothetical protein
MITRRISAARVLRTSGSLPFLHSERKGKGKARLLVDELADQPLTALPEETKGKVR